MRQLQCGNFESLQIGYVPEALGTSPDILEVMRINDVRPQPAPGLQSANSQIGTRKVKVELQHADE